MTDLGWLNYPSQAGPKIREVMIRCHDAGHKPSDRDVGPLYRGLDHVVACEICKYQYHYCSAD